MPRVVRMVLICLFLVVSSRLAVAQDDQRALDDLELLVLKLYFTVITSMPAVSQDEKRVQDTLKRLIDTEITTETWVNKYKRALADPQKKE